MKNWFWIPLATLVGLVAGSWGPREDLKSYQEQSQVTKTAKKASDASGFGAFARMVAIPEVAKRQRKPRHPRILGPSEDESPSPVVTNDVPKKVSNPPLRHLSPEDLKARIDEAAALWSTRVELAKTQWKARLGLSGQDASESFDAALGQMNETLRETMVALADEIERTGKMTPELGLRLMGDASAAMATAYDALGETVAPEKRAEISELPVYEFIDPSVAEPLVGVQDKLEPSFDRRWRR